ncbi:MAG: hypothetical protein Q8P11_03815 [bacterium]|nr:hypothetical protein [bacterium]
MPRKKRIHKAWVLTVDMGYGHQRPAHVLQDIAYNGIITVNDFPGIPAHEKATWTDNRKGYEWISRMKSAPVIGNALFEIFDKIQEIPSFYPRRDLSKSNLQLLHTYRLIEKEQVCRYLFNHVLSEQPDLPLVCTFFLPAFAAEVYGYQGDIYLQVCDADMSRTWVARDPKKSRIKYLAPNKRVVERLKLYGVPEKNIFFTGFPLPKENIGGLDAKILKKDLGARIYNLDPHSHTRHKFGHIINYHLSGKNIPKRATHPLTLMFAVGGAGGQRELGGQILKSLKTKILKGAIDFILVAGVKQDVADYFKSEIKALGLNKELGESVKIIIEKTKKDYFDVFNKALRMTDILWTKPSELSFYTALGLPIIMAPSIGSQEDFNRMWLKTIAAGISQDDPRYTDEWLFDWLNSGWLARAALNGFVEAPVMGTYNVEKLILGKVKNSKDITPHVISNI